MSAVSTPNAATRAAPGRHWVPGWAAGGRVRCDHRMECQDNAAQDGGARRNWAMPRGMLPYNTPMARPSSSAAQRLRLVRPPVDAELFAHLGGDPEAFMSEASALVAASVRRTLGVTDRVSRAVSARHRHLEVEDAVQETFARLFANDARLLRTFDAARASMSTFLTLVARSVTLDLVRKRRHIMVTLDDAGSSAAGSVTDQDPVEVAERSAPIQVPSSLLTGRQVLVLRLLFDEGRPVEQVAAMLNVDAQTVRSTKHKAIERLREFMSERGIGDAAGARAALRASAGREGA
ncbi:MAG: sigma-70 family RNA polymerase sigma factor [Phycisphaerales bacterium]|nr:sigma-70 family RNA polymerase sigma factor [Phycisphaerales bacterium]